MLTLKEIEAARDRIHDKVVRTPCVPAEAVGEAFGGRAWFKLENLQRTGSFKERGALNRILCLADDERRRGVIAASAGNHAQGVALAAKRLGIPATIVMPESTPLVKVKNTADLGATVVTHGAGYDDAMAHALELKERHGLTLIHPFDHEDVIAGQGTIGLELVEQVPEMDVVVVGVGGGGIISGIALAVKEKLAAEAKGRTVRVIGVESEAMDAARRSLLAGERVTIERRKTLADGISVRQIGLETFPLIQRYVDEIVTVSEAEIVSAVFTLLERQKVLAEAASATTLAAVLGGKIPDLAGKNVVMVLSGGNIDVTTLSRIVNHEMVGDGRLCHLRVKVDDQPGQLAALSRILAEKNANVLSLDQKRDLHGLWVTDAEIALTLETRGPGHVRELKAELEARGYEVEFEDKPKVPKG